MRCPLLTSGCIGSWSWGVWRRKGTSRCSIRSRRVGRPGSETAISGFWTGISSRRSWDPSTTTNSTRFGRGWWVTRSSIPASWVRSPRGCWNRSFAAITRAPLSGCGYWERCKRRWTRRTLTGRHLRARQSITATSGLTTFRRSTVSRSSTSGRALTVSGNLRDHFAGPRLNRAASFQWQNVCSIRISAALFSIRSWSWPSPFWFRMSRATRRTFLLYLRGRNGGEPASAPLCSTIWFRLALSSKAAVFCKQTANIFFCCRLALDGTSRCTFRRRTRLSSSIRSSVSRLRNLSKTFTKNTFRSIQMNASMPFFWGSADNRKSSCIAEVVRKTNN